MKRTYCLGAFIGVCFFALAFQSAMHSQGNDVNECKKLLLDYVGKIKNASRPGGGKTCKIIMESKSFFRAKTGLPEQSITSEILVSKNRMKNTSSNMALYGDENNLVSILHNEKIIIVAGSLGDSIMDERFNVLMQFQQEYIRNSRVLSCKDASIHNKKVKHIIAEPSKSVMENYKIHKIVYDFDAKKNTMYIVTMFYKNHESLFKQQVTYKYVNYNYKKEKIKPALSYIYGPNNKLLARYKSYEVILK